MAHARAPDRGRRARRLMLTLGALALAALVVVALTLWNNRVPLQDPPGLLVRLATYLSTNRVETSENPRFPERRSLLLDADVDAVAAQLPEMLVALGWTVLANEPGRIEAEVRSRLFRFRDRVTIRYVSRDDRRTQLDLVSESRVGRADFGANTRHLLELRRALEDAALLSP